MINVWLISPCFNLKNHLLLCAWVSYILCDWCRFKIFDRAKWGFKYWGRVFVISSACLSGLLTISAKILQQLFLIVHMFNPLKYKWWPRRFSQCKVFSKPNSWLNKKSNWKPNTVFVVSNSMIYKIILFICYVSLTVITKSYRKILVKKPSNFFILTMFYCLDIFIEPNNFI